MATKNTRSIFRRFTFTWTVFCLRWQRRFQHGLGACGCPGQTALFTARLQRFNVQVRLWLKRCLSGGKLQLCRWRLGCAVSRQLEFKSTQIWATSHRKLRSRQCLSAPTNKHFDKPSHALSFRGPVIISVYNEHFGRLFNCFGYGFECLPPKYRWVL